MKKFRNRKSVDSIDNVLDAFLALKDIDDEEVIGMVRNVKKVNEGVDISLVTSTNAELDDAREFIKNDKNKDEDVEIEVIDANADAIDHVKNNKDYIGQVILCCNRCHSNKFIDMTDLVPSEEDPNLYNVEEECPFCKESGFGYRVVGQVGKVQTPVENNIEPSVEDEDEDEVSFNTEDNGGVDDEASFDNDVAAEDENSDENSEAEATESEDTVSLSKISLISVMSRLPFSSICALSHALLPLGKSKPNVASNANVVFEKLYPVYSRSSCIFSGGYFVINLPNFAQNPSEFIPLPLKVGAFSVFFFFFSFALSVFCWLAWAITLAPGATSLGA